MLYRLVADYGYGDRSWIAVNLTAEEVVEKLEERGIISEDRALEMLEMPNKDIGDWLIWEFDNCIYEIEYHHPGDVEDFDWMDS